MTEVLFNKTLHVSLKSGDAEERRLIFRVNIELQFSSNPVRRKDFVVRLTDFSDFLFSLVITEEDFQSLKVQEGLIVDFTSFPQKFISMLEMCICEQDKLDPRFVLQITSASQFDHSPSTLTIVEMNPFKHLTYLSLKLFPGSEADIKKYMASYLSTVEEEKHQLELRLRKTEEDLSRQQKHTQEMNAQLLQRLQELEASHHSNASNREQMERNYESDATIQELRAKLAGMEEVCQRFQKMEHLINQLQNRVAALEKVVKQKEPLDDANQNLEEGRATLENKENTVIAWLKKKPFSQLTFEMPGAAVRTGSVEHAMMDSNVFPSSLGQNYTRSVLSLHTPASGPKVQFNPISAQDSVGSEFNKENGEPVGLDSKCFERRNASIPLHGPLPSMDLNKDDDEIPLQ